MFTCRMKALLKLFFIIIIAIIIAGFLVTSCGEYAPPAPGATGGESFPIPTPTTYNGPVTANISGTVIACADQGCSTSQPLPGATVTLTLQNVQGSYRIATTTADASGNYSFQPLELSTDRGQYYTVSATGTDASNINYAGNTPITADKLSGYPSSITINIQVFPA
jgi:hypothetical protein